MISTAYTPLSYRFGIKAYPPQMGINYASCGCYCVYSLPVIKIDALTGKRLPGAVFSLIDYRGCTQKRTTDDNGIAPFIVVPGVPYYLYEIKAPNNYQAVRQPLYIFIDYYGRVYLNGRYIYGCYVVVPNCPEKRGFSFTAKIIDGITGVALPGAFFELVQNGQRIDGQRIASAISDQNGNLTFSNLLPGEYLLVETAASPGYQNSHRSYRVVVTDTGEITINGVLAEGYEIPNIESFHLFFLKVAATRDE